MHLILKKLFAKSFIVPESFKQINHQTYSIEETIDHKGKLKQSLMRFIWNI